MEFKDYYKILGIDPGADDKAIKAAYRKLARKYHPDVSEHQDAEAQFKEVSEAYEVLRDPNKRAEYDEIRQYGAHNQSFRPPPGWQPGGRRFHASQGDFSDFFSTIFGGGFAQSDFEDVATGGREDFGFGRTGPRRGRDIETDMPIFLEDTLSEESKSISYELGGVSKTLNVKIPAGVSDGERIRLKEQGAPGSGGGPNGDLYLRIRLVPHPLFDVEGHNLILTLPLAPWEAALGTKVEIPTLRGRLNLTIPPNSQSGQRLRLKGKGLVKKDGRHGDLFAVIKIVMPAKSDAGSRELWQKLAEKAAFNPRAEWRSNK